MAESGYRFRAWVDGQLVYQRWVLTSDPPEAAAEAPMEQSRICQAAHEAGSAWLLEVYDPDLPEERAYLRWGSDQAGMVEPRLAPLADVLAEAFRRFAP